MHRALSIGELDRVPRAAGGVECPDKAREGPPEERKEAWSAGRHGKPSSSVRHLEFIGHSSVVHRDIHHQGPAMRSTRHPRRYGAAGGREISETLFLVTARAARGSRCLSYLVFALARKNHN
jgi:hypothetical protein